MRRAHAISAIRPKGRAFFSNRIGSWRRQSWKPYLGGQPTAALRQAYVRRLEERYRSDYTFYAGSGEIKYDGRAVQALGLPRRVLENFYSGNTRRVFKLDAPAPR